MRAGPLSNSKVISLLNRFFVPVYAMNEDYRDGGAAPAADRAEYNRIFKQSLAPGLSTGNVHVYILSPEGIPVDSLPVATAGKTDRVSALLARVIEKLPMPEG